MISKAIEWSEFRYIAKNRPLDNTTTLEPIIYNTLYIFLLYGKIAIINIKKREYPSAAIA